MEKEQRVKQTKGFFKYYLLAVLLVFALGTTASYLYLKPKLAFESSFIENIESRQSNDTIPPDSSRLYKPSGETLPAESGGLSKDSTLVTAEDEIKKYMESYGVRLLDLYMDKNGIMYIDLSNELRKKFTGDVSDEYRIVSGLYEGIKKAVPDFKGLKILIEGEEAESFGGHIDISKPIGEEITGDDKGKTDRYF